MDVRGSKCIEMTQGVVDRVKIFRLDSAVGGGFQRQLRKDRIPGMVVSLTAPGTICPPVVLAELGNDLILIDGQHRIAAWRVKEFPLKAVVFKVSSISDAARAFVDTNRKAQRVSLKHVLAVDPSEHSQHIRAIAKHWNTTPDRVNAVITGYVGNKRAACGEITDEEWTMVGRVLADWADDRRWAINSLYSSPAVMLSLGRLLRGSKAPEATLKEIKGMNFSDKGPLAKKTNTGVREAMYQHIARQVI